MTNFQAQTERANFCSCPIENVKGAQIETNSKIKPSSPRTCGFKPLTGIFPTAERPDNRMKKGLMTKSRRGRTKEHRGIPANDPNVPNTNSWGKQMKGKTQNPETKRAHKINHLMGKNAYKDF